MEKKCSKCKKVLFVENFVKDGSKKDGYYSSCRTCNGHKRMSCGMSVDTFGYLIYKGERIHRIIAEMKYGRKIKKGEAVHHVNDDKTDNRFGNVIILSHSEHAKLHLDRYRDIVNVGRKYCQRCVICNTWFFSKSKKSLYCSPTCVYKKRNEYIKNWWKEKRKKQKILG